MTIRRSSETQGVLAADEGLREALRVAASEDWLFKAWLNGAMVDVLHRLNGTADSRCPAAFLFLFA